MTGSGSVEGNQLVIPGPDYRCDDGTEPQPMGGPGLNEELRNLTYTLDPLTDTLSVGIGDVWVRENAEAPNPAPQPSEQGERTRSMQQAATAASWDGLVAKGHFADVVREAETLGLETVLASRGASDLKALGQAARYVGKRPLALRAFTALRERNRGSESARNAAFFLARLQEEQGNQAEALRWLERAAEERSHSIAFLTVDPALAPLRGSPRFEALVALRSP